jgi:hypothetical protein
LRRAASLGGRRPGIKITTIYARNLMSMHLSRRRFVGTAGAAVAAPFIGLQPARAATEITFALPWIPHGGYAFAFAARKLGYWSDRGLDVQVDRGFGSGETCKRVALGQLRPRGLCDHGENGG